MTRFEPLFFQRDTLQVARDLLGQRLVRIVDGQQLAGLIVEAEAYIGETDSACHAARGRTSRTEVMYGPAGRAYVYFIYGMYHCLNVVTEREGFPAAVLLRAVEPREGLPFIRERRSGRPDWELANGPGKVCAALDIDKRLNGTDLIGGTELFLELGEPVPESRIARSPRIGIKVDDVAATVPWRVYVADSPFVSTYKPKRS